MSEYAPDHGVSVPHWVVVATVAAHLLLPVGWVLTVRVGRPRFFGLYLYSAVALLLFDVLLLAVAQSDPWKASRFQRTLIDGRVVAILLALTVAAFASSGRGPLAYALAAATGTSLVYRSVLREQHVGPTLLLVGILGMTLLAAKVFTVPFLAQTPDSFVHSDITARIIETESLSAYHGSRYDGFLLFHVLAATVGLFAAAPARSAAGLLLVVAFSAAAVGVFAVVRNIGCRTAVAAVAATLVVTNVAFLNWGAKAHYQSLSFVLLVFLLFLVFLAPRTRRGLVLLVPVAVAWANVHHLSVAMGSLLLTVPLAIGWWFRNRGPIGAGGVLLLLGTVVVTKWSILTAWLRVPITWVFIHSPLAKLGETDINIGTTGFYVSVYNDFGSLLDATLPFLVDRLHLSPLLALTAVGGLALLRRRTRLTRVLLALAALPVVVYFPNPIWLPLRGVALLTRWDIIALPFLVGVVAVGTTTLVRSSGRSDEWILSTLQPVAICLFVFLTVFATVSTGFYAPTTSDFIGADRYDKQYLDRQDLAAADWTKDHADRDRLTYATSKLSKYLEHTTGPTRANPLRARRGRISGVGGTFLFPNGLTMVQVRSFQTRAVKVAFTPRAGYYPNRTDVLEPVSGEYITYDRNAASVVYDNGATVVHESDGRRNRSR